MDGGTAAAIALLDGVVSELVQAAWADSSLRTKAGQLAWWWDFCRGTGVDPLAATADGATLRRFAAFLFMEGRLPAPYLAAVSTLRRALALPRGEDPDMSLVVRGAGRLIREARLQAGHPRMARWPLKPWWLRCVRWPAAVTGPGLPRTRSHALLTATYLAVGSLHLMRARSMRELCVRDVDLDALTITDRAGKTDTRREGQVHHLDASQHPLAPRILLGRWLASAGLRDADPLFPRPDVDGTHARPMSPAMQQQLVRGFGLFLAALPEPAQPFDMPRGIVASLSHHSLRYGGAAAMRDAGAPSRDVQLRGKWASDAFLQYVASPPALWVPDDRAPDLLRRMLRCGEPQAEACVAAAEAGEEARWR